MELDHDSKKPVKRKIHKVPYATETLGEKLKIKRDDDGFSLSDIVEMTGFSQSAIVDMENGTVTNINYYLEYAKTLDYELPDLFQIDIGKGSLFPLSLKKQERAFLTKNIKKLYFEEDFFSTQRSVKDIVNKLTQLNVFKVKDEEISSKVSSVIFNLMKEGFLKVAGKSGRNNLYQRDTKKPLPTKHH